MGLYERKERAYGDGKPEEVTIGRQGRKVTDGGRVSAQVKWL